jgi:hypothetical protein
MKILHFPILLEAFQAQQSNSCKRGTRAMVTRSARFASIIRDFSTKKSRGCRRK